MRDEERAVGPAYKARILPWRIVGGAFVHFLVPFYLVALVADLALGPHIANAEAALRHILVRSPMLLGGYAVLGVTATVIAALVDPVLGRRRGRREALDPRMAARRSERQLSTAIARGRGAFGPRADAALAGIETRWDHKDARYQALSRDLAETVDASIRALASARVERRPALTEMATVAIERLAAAHDALTAESAGEDERQARILAGYVETRYGFDSTGGAL